MQDNSQTINKAPTFQDRDFEEVEGGYYDNNGNYMTPNGSFWDENQIYYNRDGFDKFGGIFDEYGTYYPGQDWNDELCCYNSVLANHELVNHQALQQALQENLKQELLDEYYYYQNFFKNTDENPEMLASLEVPINPEFPLKEEYYGANPNSYVTRSPIPTPNKKVDTVVYEKSPLQQL
jgi:hypothetical protein